MLFVGFFFSWWYCRLNLNIVMSDIGCYRLVMFVFIEGFKNVFVIMFMVIFKEK